MATREQHLRILVVTGGEKTEPEYLRYLNSALNTSGVKIEVSESGRDPGTLVREAVLLASRDRSEARSSGDRSNVFDTVWVLCDVDDFGPGLPGAIREAAANDVKIALSNPCFELWLLWHQQDQGYCTTPQVEAQASRAGVVKGKNNKSIVVSAIEGRFRDAQARSRVRRSQHARNGVEAPDDNPSSDVDLLVESLINAAARARPGSTPSFE